MGNARAVRPLRSLQATFQSLHTLYNALGMRTDTMAARPARLPSPTALMHSARALCASVSLGTAPRVHAQRPLAPRYACSTAQRRPLAAAAGGGSAAPDNSVLFISPVRAAAAPPLCSTASLQQGT